MKKYLAQFIVFGMIVASFRANAQENATLVIKAVNGKDGNPLPLQHLVIFGGESPEGPRFHDFHLDAETDKTGSAVITLDVAKVKWIQVWVDKLVLCQEKPNFKSFEVHQIQTTGSLSPNTCGTQKQSPASDTFQAPASGTFTVFARPSTIADRLGR